MSVLDTEPLVSIALPVYNGEKTIAVAIQSLLVQTYHNIELIIIDDSSTDNSLKVIEEVDNNKIILIKNKHNSGLSASLNNAVDLASGKYLARMDQDDISFPFRIERQVNYLLNNPGIDLIASATIIFDEEYQILGELPVKTKHEDICSSPLKGFYMPHPTWMGKIEWFRKNKYRSCSDGAEDQNLLFRTYKESAFACISEPLLAYREERRTFRKMIRARKVFSYSNAKTALQNKQPIAALKIVLWQCSKAFGDILNIFLRISAMRNKLQKPSKKTLFSWEEQVKHYVSGKVSSANFR